MRPRRFVEPVRPVPQTRINDAIRSARVRLIGEDGEQLGIKTTDEAREYAYSKNLDLVREVEAMAREKGCTTAQLALAWVLAQGEDIVPIPGTKHVRYLDDNIGALEVHLTDADLKRLDEILPPGAAAGLRYHERGMETVNR